VPATIVVAPRSVVRVSAEFDAASERDFRGGLQIDVTGVAEDGREVVHAVVKARIAGPPDAGMSLAHSSTPLRGDQ
jgi:hypothetical protein